MRLRILLLAISLGTAGWGWAADEQLPTLKVGKDVYSKVTVTSVTATDIYFNHSRGFGNAKLKDLEPALQEHFHFDPVKAAAKQAEQAKANALYAKAARETPPPKRPSETSPPQQPELNGRAGWGDIGVRNASGRSGSYYLPPGYHQKEVPLVVLMHGSGGSGADMVNLFRALAAERGFAIVAPDSRQLRDGLLTWEVPNHPGETGEDRIHTMNCVHALEAMPGVRVDSRRTLIAGYSGGGSSAPYIASNESLFQSFAVLHGGIIPGGYGNNRVRGWFSGGDSDQIRPIEGVRKAMEQLETDGWESKIEFQTFTCDHAPTVAEMRAVIEWWLGK